MRSSSAAADRDMKLQEASALEEVLEALREQEGSKLDPDVEAEYLSRIETLRKNAAAVWKLKIKRHIEQDLSRTNVEIAGGCFIVRAKRGSEGGLCR